MFKCWTTFIGSYILVSYRTVGMLHDTWYYKHGNIRYDSLDCHMQAQLAQMTRWIHAQ